MLTANQKSLINVSIFKALTSSVILGNTVENKEKCPNINNLYRYIYIKFTLSELLENSEFNNDKKSYFVKYLIPSQTIKESLESLETMTGLETKVCLNPLLSNMKLVDSEISNLENLFSHLENTIENDKEIITKLEHIDWNKVYETLLDLAFEYDFDLDGVLDQNQVIKLYKNIFSNLLTCSVSIPLEELVNPIHFSKLSNLDSYLNKDLIIKEYTIKKTIIEYTYIHSRFIKHPENWFNKTDNKKSECVSNILNQQNFETLYPDNYRDKSEYDCRLETETIWETTEKYDDNLKEIKKAVYQHTGNYLISKKVTSYTILGSQKKVKFNKKDFIGLLISILDFPSEYKFKFKLTVGTVWHNKKQYRIENGKLKDQYGFSSGKDSERIRKISSDKNYSQNDSEQWSISEWIKHSEGITTKNNHGGIILRDNIKFIPPTNSKRAMYPDLLGYIIKDTKGTYTYLISLHKVWDKKNKQYIIQYKGLIAKEINQKLINYQFQQFLLDNKNKSYILSVLYDNYKKAPEVTEILYNRLIEGTLNNETVIDTLKTASNKNKKQIKQISLKYLLKHKNTKEWAILQTMANRYNLTNLDLIMLYQVYGISLLNAIGYCHPKYISHPDNSELGLCQILPSVLSPDKTGEKIRIIE